MSVVTKTGDAGKTSLASGKRVSKSSLQVDTYGTLDELVSFLGLARCATRDKKIATHIKKIQAGLFFLGTELAGGKNKGINASHLKHVEGLISEYERGLDLKGFAIPGDSLPSALMDVARSICRRLERKMVALTEQGKFKNAVAFKYINRLSDLLFIFARNC